ncbi:MAG TPA: PIN domain-containing protein [Armatimonadaceae bacterium]|nr:PIN domain-containing protein [Armatimonadaceae bacterium]
MKYVVDTHALIWYLAGNPRLGTDAARALSHPASELILPAIALAEVCWIVARRATGVAVGDVLAALDADPRLSIHPLDRAVIERSEALAGIAEMHDRQIAATALLLIDRGEAAALLAADANITASGLVPVVW